MTFIGTRNNPKGPNTMNINDIQIGLSGSQLTFKTPVYTIPLIEYEKNYSNQSYNIDNPFLIRPEESISSAILHCFASGWIYTGLPMIDGYLGSLSMYAYLTEVSKEINLFQENQLEDLTIEILKESIGPSKTDGRDIVKFPIDWKTYRSNSIPWINLKVSDFIDPENDYKMYFITPISDTCFLTVRFDRTLSGVSYEPLTSQVYPITKKMNKLIQEIISTFRLDLSENHKKIRQEAHFYPESHHFSHRDEIIFNIEECLQYLSETSRNIRLEEYHKKGIYTSADKPEYLD